MPLLPADPTQLAAWLIGRGWHEATGVDAMDAAMHVMDLLADQVGPEEAAEVFREAMHLVRFRDGHPLCPGCRAMPRLVVFGSQAFCGDEDCDVFMWDPREPDGGASNPATIDSLMRPTPRTG